MSSGILFAACLISLTVYCFANVPLSQFFPYGSSAGDVLVPPSDDGSSPQVQLNNRFPFFNYSQTALWVNVNGVLSFRSVIATYTPECRSLQGDFQMIAPYWCDIDIRFGGSIPYRQTSDATVLAKAKTEIVNAFPEFSSLQLTWAFIATYLNTPFYGASDVCDGRSKTDTFQVILATDNVHSFAIFYYNNIMWTTGTASHGNCTGLGGQPAKAGFDAGDGVSLFVIPGSCTDDIINIANWTNVNSPGKFVFRVDQANIQSAGNMTLQTPPPGITTTMPMTTTQVLPAPPTEHSCACTVNQLYLDVVLVIDVSASITPNGLSTIVGGFLAGTFSQFNISQDVHNTRVGVVTFSNNAQTRAILSTYNSFKPLYALLNSLAGVPTSEDIVNIQPALEAAEAILYGNGPLANGSYTNGNRLNAPDLVILVASDNSISDATGVANRIKARNGTIITLAAKKQGTGNRPDLSNLASPGLAFSSDSTTLHDNVTNAVCAINCYCPAGFTRYATSAECVFASESTAPWQFAESSCEDRSPLAYLADELSPNKHDLLKNMAASKGFLTSSFWIGLRYNASSSSYQWIQPNGSLPLQSNGYQAWAIGFPTPSNNPICIKETRTTGFIVQWKNEDCGQFYHYFCQFPACDTDNYCNEAQAIGHIGGVKKRHA